MLEWAGDDARTVIVLHGYLDHSASFVTLGDALAARGHRVLAPDFRGHGRSGWAPEGAYYHFPDYVADLAGVLAHLAPAERVTRWSLVAHSMGGTVATILAGVFPERVRALVLLEGSGPSAMPVEAVPMRYRRWIEGVSSPRARERRRIESIEEAVDRLRATHGGAVPDAVLTVAARELVEPHPSGQGLTWRFDPLHQTTSPARFDAKAFAHLAERIDAPTLLVEGEHSPFVSLTTDERRASYRRHERITVPEAGHMMHWTHPDAVSGLVCAFLARADST